MHSDRNGRRVFAAMSSSNLHNVKLPRIYSNSDSNVRKFAKMISGWPLKRFNLQRVQKLTFWSSAAAAAAAAAAVVVQRLASHLHNEQ